jgi:hypothetical protein
VVNRTDQATGPLLRLFLGRFGFEWIASYRVDGHRGNAVRAGTSIPGGGGPGQVDLRRVVPERFERAISDTAA